MAHTKEMIEEKLELDLSDGATIETSAHRDYFLYVLENAKQEICIQSPWVRYEILELYKKYIESALERGVKVSIKYGLKPRHKSDKVGIDPRAKEYLQSLQGRYKGRFKLQEGNDHSKVLICDEKFMIIGSFNWLSFGGNADTDGQSRGETSTINKKRESLHKERAKFGL